MVPSTMELSILPDSSRSLSNTINSYAKLQTKHCEQKKNTKKPVNGTIKTPNFVCRETEPSDTKSNSLNI